MDWQVVFAEASGHAPYVVCENHPLTDGQREFDLKRVQSALQPRTKLVGVSGHKHVGGVRP